MAKYDVFISYSRKDTDTVNKICTAFKNSGITYFIDRRGISGGMEFPYVIANAIIDSELFVYLASKNAYNSRFTNSEITFAFNKKDRNSIIPVIIDNSELPLEQQFVFANINWRNWNERDGSKILCDDILNILGHKKPESHQDKQDSKNVLLPTNKFSLIINIFESFYKIFFIGFIAFIIFILIYKAVRKDYKEDKSTTSINVDTLSTSTLLTDLITVEEDKSDTIFRTKETLYDDKIAIDKGKIAKKKEEDGPKLPLKLTVHNMKYLTPLGEISYTGEVLQDESNSNSGKTKVPHGRGKAEIVSGALKGNIYEGLFNRGNFEDSNAIYTLTNGDIFIGVFKDNYYINGKYTIKETGEYYVGSFKNGHPNKGNWYSKDGELIQILE